MGAEAVLRHPDLLNMLESVSENDHLLSVVVGHFHSVDLDDGPVGLRHVNGAKTNVDDAVLSRPHDQHSVAPQDLGPRGRRHHQDGGDVPVRIDVTSGQAPSDSDPAFAALLAENSVRVDQMFGWQS